MTGQQPTFGQRLRELRKAKNLTQRELAERVAARLRKEGRSFDFTYLSKIEKDRTEPPSVTLITELARVLDADPNELITLGLRQRLDRGRLEEALARAKAQEEDE